MESEQQKLIEGALKRETDFLKRQELMKRLWHLPDDVPPNLIAAPTVSKEENSVNKRSSNGEIS